VWLALAWLGIAVGLRVVGLSGGDAAIASGLLFLVWTIPFGMMWQFVLYQHAVKVLRVDAAQLLGDALTIGVFTLFWFILVPGLVKRAKTGGRP